MSLSFSDVNLANLDDGLSERSNAVLELLEEGLDIVGPDIAVTHAHDAPSL